MALHAVIPAGGAGTRLWPRSRRAQPKHVLALTGGRTLLEETVARVRPLTERINVLTEARQVPLVAGLLPDLGRRLIVEPVARGTASALGLAALTLLQEDPDAIMLSVAADHVIRGQPAFESAIKRAVKVAEGTGCLVTIGLRPRYPATGYGYVRIGGAQVRGGGHPVAEFVEKPNAARAAAYVDSGQYFWNLSMFCWRASKFMDELRLHSPRHARGLEGVARARGRGDEELALRLYSRLPTQAVDYAVLEKTADLRLVPATFGWNDVGSWAELHEILDQDQEGNVLEGDSVLIDTRDSFISVPGRLVAAVGLDEMIVVGTEDALLICPKSRAQDVKRVVAALERSGRIRYL